MSAFSRLGAAELIVGSQGIASVHRRRPASHVDSESNRLDDLFAGSSVLMGHLGMVSNATLAMNRDSDCERHQFFCFSVEGFGCRCRSRKRAESLRRIWRALPQQPDPAYYVVSDLHIVLAHVVLPAIETVSELKSDQRRPVTLLPVQASFTGRQPLARPSQIF